MSDATPPDVPQPPADENPFASPELPTAEIVGVDELQPESQAAPRRPWGFWATTGFTVAIFIAFLAAQTAVVVVYFAAYASTTGRSMHDPKLIESLKFNGLMISIATCVSAPVCLGLIAWFVRLRRRWTFSEYVGLCGVRWTTMFGWLGLMAVVLFGWEGLGRLTDVPPSEFMVDVYQTAGFPPLLWLAIVVLAPLVEEIWFRGFMFRGIQASPLGNVGAILIAAFVWTLLHVGQYGVFILVWIFLVGILLGIARARTGSLWPPIAMHLGMNLAAMVQMAFYFG